MAIQAFPSFTPAKASDAPRWAAPTGAAGQQSQPQSPLVTVAAPEGWPCFPGVLPRWAWGYKYSMAMTWVSPAGASWVSRAHPAAGLGVGPLLVV